MFKFLRDTFGAGETKPVAKPTSMPPQLILKGGKEFFDMQCKFGHTTIIPKQGIVALVVDEAEGGAPVRTMPNGIQILTVQVAADDGGFQVVTQTAGKGLPLRGGDVVIWVPFEHNKEMASMYSDKRCGWIGLVMAKVKHDVDIRETEFQLLCEYK